MLTSLNVDVLRATSLSLVVLLAGARLLGHLARRRGIPPIVGEIAAGVLLGPTVLGAIAPALGEHVLPSAVPARAVLDGFAFLGIVLLLASAGASLDLPRAATWLRNSSWLPVLSFVVPLGVGLGLGATLPERFLAGADRPLAAVFVAVILAVSALPTIARTLQDLDLLSREVGLLTLAAAAVDDVAGWFLLAVVTAAVRDDAAGLGVTIVTATAFFLTAWFVGRRVVDVVLRVSLRMTDTVSGPLTTVIVVILVTVWAAAVTGLDPVVGALVAGMLVGASPALRPAVHGSLDEMTTAVFGPLFFALVGASLDLGLLSTGIDLAWTLGLLVAAVVAKLVGARLGGALSGLPAPVATAVGIGLSARGGLGIVVASVAVGVGMLSPTGYAAFVVVSVVTSLLAPFLLARAVAGLPVTVHEREDLRRRQLLEESGVVGARRVLLLTRGGPHSRVAARVCDLSLDPAASVTVLVVDDGSADAPTPPDEAAEQVAALLGHRRTEVRVLRADDVVAAIDAESRRGYDLLVVGASGDVQNPVQFGAILNGVLLRCSIPVLLVRSRVDAEGLVFRRLLTSATGTEAAQAAQDVAFALARNGGAAVDVLHVIARSDRILYASWFNNAEEQPAPNHLLTAAAVRAGLFDVEVGTHVRVGSAPAEELVAAAVQAHADTIVVSTAVRALQDRPFLGHGIEYLLEHAPQNLVIVATPAST